MLNHNRLIKHSIIITIKSITFNIKANTFHMQRERERESDNTSLGPTASHYAPRTCACGAVETRCGAAWASLSSSLVRGEENLFASPWKEQCHKAVAEYGDCFAIQKMPRGGASCCSLGGQDLRPLNWYGSAGLQRARRNHEICTHGQFSKFS